MRQASKEDSKLSKGLLFFHGVRWSYDCLCEFMPSHLLWVKRSYAVFSHVRSDAGAGVDAADEKCHWASIVDQEVQTQIRTVSFKASWILGVVLVQSLQLYFSFLQFSKRVTLFNCEASCLEDRSRRHHRHALAARWTSWTQCLWNLLKERHMLILSHRDQEKFLHAYAIPLSRWSAVCFEHFGQIRHKYLTLAYNTRKLSEDFVVKDC